MAIPLRNHSLQVWYPQRIGHGEAYEPGIGSPAAGLPNQIDVPITMEAATREKTGIRYTLQTDLDLQVIIIIYIYMCVCM